MSTSTARRRDLTDRTYHFLQLVMGGVLNVGEVAARLNAHPRDLPHLYRIAIEEGLLPSWYSPAAGGDRRDNVRVRMACKLLGLLRGGMSGVAPLAKALNTLPETVRKHLRYAETYGMVSLHAVGRADRAGMAWKVQPTLPVACYVWSEAKGELLAAGVLNYGVATKEWQSARLDKALGILGNGFGYRYETSSMRLLYKGNAVIWEASERDFINKVEGFAAGFTLKGKAQ